MSKETFYLSRSPRKGKKWRMSMPRYGHHHDFGDSNYDDYTIHKDETRAENYRRRHRNDKINDVHSAGALSWFILWSSPSLQQGIKNYEKKFNVRVVRK
mgnify:FL=1